MPDSSGQTDLSLCILRGIQRIKPLPISKERGDEELVEFETGGLSLYVHFTSREPLFHPVPARGSQVKQLRDHSFGRTIIHDMMLDDIPLLSYSSNQFVIAQVRGGVGLRDSLLQPLFLHLTKVVNKTFGEPKGNPSAHLLVGTCHNIFRKSPRQETVLLPFVLQLPAKLNKLL